MSAAMRNRSPNKFWILLNQFIVKTKHNLILKYVVFKFQCQNFFTALCTMHALHATSDQAGTSSSSKENPKKMT